ncbi:MAG: betaine--homocysteine S-methyltransferase [Candidatus Puniceispirillaceae bacterium]
MRQTFEQISATRDWLLADGATGTNLFHAGLETGYPPELWNVEYPDRVTTLHASFIAAGADIILTNSFGGTSFRLKLHQAENSVNALNLAAAGLARQAADAADKPVLVAGSMGPTGELFQPLGALTADAAEQAFAEQAFALAEGGADLLWIETMSSLEEVEAAVKGARRTNLPVAATMTFDTAGRTMMGVTPAAYAEFATSLGLDAFGANCGVGPAELLDSVHKFKHREKNPAVIAKGNCGIPVYVDGKVHYHGTPELMADYAVLARDLGVKIIGGCCGTSPEHVRAMAQALNQTPSASPATLAEIEAKMGKPWKDLPHSAEDGQSRRRRKRRRG